MRVGTRVSDDMTFLKKEDHPHACGDKTTTVAPSFVKIGSSPCVWGQATKSALLAKGDRIIPMRVGTSTPLPPQVHGNKDHPHACGDKFVSLYTLKPLMGSSPCVWGQDTLTSTATTALRIIPMRVGTSSVPLSALLCGRDHPHACGDKDKKSLVRVAALGSSPCVWGQEAHSRKLDLYKRIIPMRVGTRTATGTDMRTDKDHPHACGDKTLSSNPLIAR